MEEKEYQQIIQKFKEKNKELINSAKCRKIFTEILPKWKEGKNKGGISWFNTFGYKVKFIYDDVEGEVEIIDYNSEKQELIIKYNEKDIYIKTGNFMRCKLGRKFGVVKYSNDFYYNIRQTFKEEKRDIIIIDREYRLDKSNNQNKKWYKYKCNVCGWNEGWISEGHINDGNGCACCSNRVPVLGINTIWDTDKWMISIINDDEFCKTHTHSCSDKVYPTCPDCGRVKGKLTSINHIYTNYGVSCICSDNFSYPEKVMFNVLEQLNIKFEYHKIFEWSKNTKHINSKLCGSKEYDFYFKFNNEEYIIETHGSQHYIDGKFSSIENAKTLKEEQENDKVKKELALVNGIKEENYIIIDCSNVYLKNIKLRILESNLNNLFNLNKVDWNNVGKFASSNLIKIACTYKNNNPSLSIKDISKIMNIGKTTIFKFLTIGKELGWYNYDAKLEKEIQSTRYGKKLKCIELDILFNSLRDCSKYFKEKLNIQLFSNCIGMVCNNKLESYKGYHFEFTNEDEYNIPILKQAM